MKRKRTTVFLALAIAMMAVLVSGQLSPARADLAAVSPTTTNVLLTFPDWYADKSGVGLAQCNFDGTAGDPNCIGGSPLAPGPGFEAFYFAADPPAGSLDGGNASNVIMVMGIEAVPADPTPGAPGVVFARIRLRADLIGPGVYTLTHPFGVLTENILTAGRRAINTTVDIPAPGTVSDFTGVLAGPIGPFLTCVNPAPPAGYIGNYGVPCTFTGSPFGQNLVRLSGPGTDNVTTQLHISGKLVPPGTVTAPPLTVTSATYQCPGAACVAEVRAQADPTAVLTATVAGVQAPMALQLDGSFLGSVPLPQSSIPLPVDGLNTFPVQALVTANQAGFTIPATEMRMSLVDTVTLTQALHNTSTGILSVSATSGDPRATLAEATFGPMPGGRLFFDTNGFQRTPAIPVGSVTVLSTGAGATTVAPLSISVPERLKVMAARFNARRRRLAVIGTSTAKGATLLLQAGVKVLGTSVVPASGRFIIKTKLRRAPRFIKVLSSGGKSVRKAVTR